MWGVCLPGWCGAKKDGVDARAPVVKCGMGASAAGRGGRNYGGDKLLGDVIVGGAKKEGVGGCGPLSDTLNC